MKVPKYPQPWTDPELVIIAGAYRFYISVREKNTESSLTSALYDFGTVEMAIDFINSGNCELESTGSFWLLVELGFRPSSITLCMGGWS
jgi:hypothetical protein